MGCTSGASETNCRHHLSVSGNITAIGFNSVGRAIFIDRPTRLVIIGVGSRGPFSYGVSFTDGVGRDRISYGNDDLILRKHTPRVYCPICCGAPGPVRCNGGNVGFAKVTGILNRTGFDSNYVFIGGRGRVAILISLTATFRSCGSTPSTGDFRETTTPLRASGNFNTLCSRRIHSFRDLFSEIRFGLRNANDSTPASGELGLFHGNDKSGNLVTLLCRCNECLAVSNSHPNARTAALRNV